MRTLSPIFAILLLLFGNEVAATPSIGGQSGALTHGSAVTITGNGFTSKSPASPVAWDNFEDGSVGTTATVGSWSDINSLSIRHNTLNRNANSSYSAGSIFNGSWPTYSNAYLTGGSNATTWYVQYWLRLDPNFNWSTNIDNSRGNVKFFRMWDTGPDSKNFVAAFHQGDHVCAVVEQCTTAGPTCYMYDYNPTTELDNNQWNLLQFEYRESSAADTADGVWRMWSNGQLIYNYTNLTTKCSGHTSNSRPFIVGLFDSHDPGGTTSDVYLDDMYIDNKWNRVELANSATYGSATIREIQPPTSWSDTSITVTLNIGALTGTAYLFVTDSTGARNATGYPIALGGGGGTSYTVTPSAGANGSISPNTAQTVSSGSTTTFTVTPNSGYTASASGCGGSLSGTTYTTGTISANCTVTVTFSAIDTSSPTEPTIFGAESSSTSTIALSWIPGTDAVGPVTTDIERCNGWGCATYASITNTSASNYTDTGLTPGQIYHYRIRSRDGAGNVSAYVATHFNPLPLIPAFPSAEGAGVAAIGGRGGAICRVTNLNDSGAGSLRACTTASGPRTVVFAVAGTINLQSVLPINNPYITIAGQTAPGGGITVSAKSGYFDVIGMNTHNIIIRYIRFARGYYLNPPDETGDTISMFGPANNIVIDHVSARWANDGNIDIWRDDINEKTNNISISNSIFSEPLGDGKNINFGANNNASETMKNIDMHRNYLYGYARNPLVTVKSFRFTNNLVYNYVWEGLNTGGGMSLDAIGNKFKAGPAYPSARLPFRVFPMGGLTTPLGSPSIYVSGNVGPVTTDPAADNWPLISNSDGPGLGQNGLLGTQYRRTTPLPTLPWPVTVEPATQIESTLLPNVGASRRLDCLGDWVGNRDTVDTRVLDNYANGTGAFPTDEASVGGLPVLDAGTACADTDADGMPDAWESAQGLNPNSAADAQTIHASGYSNLERYLAGSGDLIAPVLFGFGPASPLSAASTTATLALTTDEAATCRYSVDGDAAWAAMTQFSTTGGTSHSGTITVAKGKTDWYYVRCNDAFGNLSAPSVHRLSVGDTPKRRGSR